MILQERTVATHLGDISLLTSGPANSAGTPLVLLHGMLATKEFWTHLIPHLPAHWQILAPDLWSVARDADTGTELDFQHLAEIVEAFRLALALPRIHLMAQDLGCLVQLRFVHAYPHSVQAADLAESVPVSGSEIAPVASSGGGAPLIGHLMSGPFLQASLSRYYVQGTVQKQQAAAVCHQARGTFQARTAKSCFHRWLHWGQPDSLFWDHPEMIRAHPAGFPGSIRGLRTPMYTTARWSVWDAIWRTPRYSYCPIVAISPRSTKASACSGKYRAFWTPTDCPVHCWSQNTL